MILAKCFEPFEQIVQKQFHSTKCIIVIEKPLLLLLLYIYKIEEVVVFKSKRAALHLKTRCRLFVNSFIAHIYFR